MATWNSVGSATIAAERRWDAEYFINPYNDYLTHILAHWKDWVSLSDASSKLTSGHTPLHHDVSEGDTPFITVECVDPLALNLEKSKRVFAHHAKGELARVCVKQRDVLITIKRRIALACPILSEPGLMAVNQDVAVMTPRLGFRPGYIAAVLISRVGQFQALRHSTEQMNPYINVTTLGRVLIPRVPERVQVAVENAVEERLRLLRQGVDGYREAEAELLDRLGYVELAQQPRELSYSADFSTLTTAGRSDAEFFQPYAQRIHAMLAKQGRRIFNVAKLRNELFTPQRGQLFHYIEIGDIAANTTVTCNELLGEDAPSRAQFHVRAGDIVTSTVRPLRRLSGLVAGDQDGWVCSSGFAVLEPQGVPPEYLVAYLRLPPVCQLMDAYTLASMYPAITVPDLLSMPFFLPDTRLVDRICAAVTAARTVWKEAEAKLSEAKRLVEEAIASATGESRSSDRNLDSSLRSE